ncbi:MAG: 2,3-bisphosphoglycerate-independent phosphoglycerate mutase [Candidatus Aenigmatarchaeota archaeon]
MNKLLFVILDGAADTGTKTPLSTARKPNLDMFASHSICGLFDPSMPAGYNIASFSDITTLQLLGCFAYNKYTGRGYFEALGAGIKTRPGAVYLRANFSTLDKKWNITDRRAGRDESGLEELTKAINEMDKIDGIKITLHKSSGHRAVLVLEGLGLSSKVSDSDTGEITKVNDIKSIDGSRESKKTADVLNKFMKKAYALLNQHPVNLRRKIPANFLLLRGAGSYVKVPTFNEKFGIKSCVITGVGIIRGIARFLGMTVIDVPGATGHFDTNLEGKTKAAMDALDDYDFILLHLNGADEAGHDMNFDKKKRYIEMVDEIVFSRFVKRRDINIAVAIDHTTSSKTGKHEIGAVPFMIYNGEETDDIDMFDEIHCKQGFITKNPMERVMIALARKR